MSIKSFITCFVRIPGFRYSYYLRKTSHYRSSKGWFNKVAFVYNKLLLNRYRFRYGFEIPESAKIGRGLYLDHFGGVVISPFATLGSNINLAHGVTIGRTSRGKKRGVPTIGDRVWIGAHAIVVGLISVGNDALIAPGAYLNFDVPSGAVVIGNPGKVVSYKGSAGYVNRIAPCQSSASIKADYVSADSSMGTAQPND